MTDKSRRASKVDRFFWTRIASPLWTSYLILAALLLLEVDMVAGHFPHFRYMESGAAKPPPKTGTDGASAQKKDAEVPAPPKESKSEPKAE